MRQIGSLTDEGEAKRFGDYLLAQRIENSVDEGGQGWSIWVHRDDDLERGKAELEQFAANPADPKYAAVARKAEQIRGDEQKRQRRLRKNYVDVRTGWAAVGRGARPVTLALVIICCLVALISRLGESFSVVDPLHIASIKITANGQISMGDGLQDVLHGQVWRLVTPIFIHYGLLHLVFNMMWLLNFGAIIENRKSGWWLVVLVLLIAVVSNLAQYFETHSANFGGMSGVVYGLFGYLWMKDRYQPSEGMGLPPNTVWYMLAWLVLCMTGLVGSVANTAHLVGLVVGVVIGILPYGWKRLTR